MCMKNSLLYYSVSFCSHIIRHILYNFFADTRYISKINILNIYQFSIRRVSSYRIRCQKQLSNLLILKRFYCIFQWHPIRNKRVMKIPHNNMHFIINLLTYYVRTLSNIHHIIPKRWYDVYQCYQIW